MSQHRPKILAPAGDQNSFLAAIAAGADAVYCGLKMFSARMEARNFSMEELSRLSALARSHKVELYVALNALVKEHELERTRGIIAKLEKYVRPHALILQDPGLAQLARECGFKGELHLSTLGNCTFPLALTAAEKAGFSRVVLPRELSIDEIKMMADAASETVDLEMFIHGALCYAVSGRCYWSSWFGGRSGLRGRCVQPCRRVYTQKNQKGENQRDRFFSCVDFSADVLVKVLSDIPKVTTWKIEGRKKSPHYVFYTVKAYKMLRDHGHEPVKKKIALSFLEYAMGRPTTHYNLLSQRPQTPLKMDSETGSGLFIGRIKLGEAPHVITREALLTDDLLRIGYEDDPWHTVHRVTRSVPKKGTLVLTGKGDRKGKAGKKKTGFKKGTPVFIVDRREKEVWTLIRALEGDLERYRSPKIEPQGADLTMDSTQGKLNHRPSGHNTSNGEGHSPFEMTGTPSRSPQNHSRRRKGRKQGAKPSSHIRKLTLHGFGNESKIKSGSRGKSAKEMKGLWLSSASLKRCAPGMQKEVWWFLPPVVWPSGEKQLLSVISQLRASGARNFVLNIPWQISCFYGEKGTLSKSGKEDDLNLWAGPFCNVANHAHLQLLKTMGLSGAFVSPELGSEDFHLLPKKSSLPLGIVTSGHWPLAISRTVSEDMTLDQIFKSPRGEEAWVTKKESDYWIYPNWTIDLSIHQSQLGDAGYTLFLEIDEPVPKGILLKKRPGLWNWDLNLL